MEPCTLSSGAQLTPVWVGSPNFGPRRDGLTPECLVLHYTAMASTQAARDRLCDPAYEVSAHYLISRQGQVLHLVQETDRAWHAGAGTWQGRDDLNSRSIGIELTNTGAEPFSDPQMRALERLMAGVMQRWSIPAHRVLGHSDIAPTRKIDPGARFDWARLARRGLAAQAGSIPWQGAILPDQFRNLAQRVGYSGTAEDEVLLSAVRLRWRPWGKGPLCAADFTALQGGLSDVSHAG